MRPTPVSWVCRKIDLGVVGNIVRCEWPSLMIRVMRRRMLTAGTKPKLRPARLGLLIGAWIVVACGKPAAAPIAQGTVRGPWSLHPVADQREYVRFVGRAWVDHDDVEVVHGKDARGPTLTFTSVDRRTLENAIGDLAGAGAPPIPSDLAAVYETRHAPVSLVFVEESRRLAIPSTTAVERFAARGGLPAYLKLWLPDAEAATLERLTSERTVTRLALSYGAEVVALPSVSAPTRGQPMTLYGEDASWLFQRLIAEPESSYPSGSSSVMPRVGE